jgi:3alpha(or 20beta)-hydroxysteroid dehydrogenase
VSSNAEAETALHTGRLTGKIAVVSGSARGIGRAILEAFVEADARVVGLDVLEDEGKAVCASLGPNASFRHMDVTDETHWEALSASLQTMPPDILVNNAGGLLSSAVLHEHGTEVWRRTLELNLTSVFFAMRTLIPLMLRRGSGSIINVGSVSGLVGQPDAAAYQAAKAGVSLLTRNAAVTYGPHGIRVNAISPSVVIPPERADDVDRRTASFIDRVPLGRAADPREIASAVVFLASDEAGFVTGSNVAVDGGFLA